MIQVGKVSLVINLWSRQGITYLCVPIMFIVACLEKLAKIFACMKIISIHFVLGHHQLLYRLPIIISTPFVQVIRTRFKKHWICNCLLKKQQHSVRPIGRSINFLKLYLIQWFIFNRPPPPPVPNRNIGTNLSSQSHAKSTTALNITTSDQGLTAPRRIPNSGSSNNISMTDGIENPPLPPHRVTSRVPLAPSTPPVTAFPPEVPRRHSSMRNSIENGGNPMINNQNNRYPSPNPNQPITRLVVDLEARYSLLFHSLSEFPQPKQFMNIAKSYPSQALRPTTNGI